MATVASATPLRGGMSEHGEHHPESLSISSAAAHHLYSVAALLP